MPFAAKRRWFQFTLRTLFVVVTVFGCWLGYEMNWIRQRHEFLASGVGEVRIACSFGLEQDSRPWLLRLLGAEGAGFTELWLPAETPDKQFTRIQNLFPEAEVKRGWPAMEGTES